VKVDAGIMNRVKLELAEPASTPTEIHLAWLWPDASGVGNLLLPRIKLNVDRLLRDWTIVSAESGLEIDRPADKATADHAKGVAPARSEFAEVWPEINIADSRIFGPAPDDEGRTIVVHPAEAAPHVEQST